MGETPYLEALVLVFPLPPSINHQYATVSGRRILSRAGREFKALVAETVAQWQEQEPQAEALLMGFRQHYLRLAITFYFLSALRRDLDGGLKIAQDALCEALGVNDNLVAEIRLSKRVDRSQPRIEVCLMALTDAHVSLGKGRLPSVHPVPEQELRQTPKRRRRLTRRRQQRSLADLAARYKWE